MTDPEDPVFDAKLDPEVLHFGETKPLATICPWCGQGRPEADLDACPHCGALLKPADEALEVPGVTTLGPEAVRLLQVAEEKRRRKTEPRRKLTTQVAAPALAAVTADAAEEEAAIRLPAAEVRRVMLELEASARRAGLPAEVPASSEAAEVPTPAEPEPPAA
ncbi:MAG: hypothetical protein ACRDF7_03035 [Candidatus Limnocylindrales bacterium]